MNGVVFSVKQEAEQLRNIIAKALGYPQYGINIGGGVHASADESVTLYYVDILKHPVVQELWAVPIDVTIQNIPNVPSEFGVLDEVEKNVLLNCLKDIENITEDWFQADLPT